MSTLISIVDTESQREAQRDTRCSMDDIRQCCFFEMLNGSLPYEVEIWAKKIIRRIAHKERKRTQRRKEVCDAVVTSGHAMCGRQTASDAEMLEEIDAVAETQADREILLVISGLHTQFVSLSELIASGNCGKRSTVYARRNHLLQKLKTRIGNESAGGNDNTSEEPAPFRN